MPFSHGKDGGVCVFVCFLRHRMFSHHPVGEGLAPPAWFRKAFILRGGFRPAGRPPLPTAAKEAKRRRGCPAVASRLQRSHPRTPVYGGYPYILPQKFRRAKYGSGVLFLPGHRALMQCKISACSISPPRLVPTSRGRGRGSGVRRLELLRKQKTGGSGIRPYNDLRTFTDRSETESVPWLRRPPYHA